MIEMESAFDALAEDHSGHRLKEIREDLFEMMPAVKRAMDAGMTAEEMATARQALEAVECADEVAGRVHDSLNR